MIGVLLQSLTFAGYLLEWGIEDSVFNFMNKNLLNQGEDVNAKWNGIGFEALIFICHLFWLKCLKVLIEGVFLG
jgi:hypothetical protein